MKVFNRVCTLVLNTSVNCYLFTHYILPTDAGGKEKGGRFTSPGSRPEREVLPMRGSIKNGSLTQDQR